MVQVPRWLPNAISALRIALVPVWVLCAEAANRAGEGGDTNTMVAWRFASLGVLVAIGASDVVDGFLARRFALQSQLGATLDAVADKFAQVVAFTYLALRAGPAFAAVPVWYLVLLIARDAVLLVGCGVVHRRCGSVHVEHHVHGKLASLCLFLLLVGFSAGLGDRVGAVALWATAGVVVASALLYIRDGVRQFAAGCRPA